MYCPQNYDSIPEIPETNRFSVSHTACSGLLPPAPGEWPPVRGNSLLTALLVHQGSSTWWSRKVIKRTEYTNLAFIWQIMYVIFSFTNKCGQTMHADLHASFFMKLCVLIRGKKCYRSHNSEHLTNYVIQLWGFCSSWKLQVCPCLIISENFIEFPPLLR